MDDFKKAAQQRAHKLAFVKPYTQGLVITRKTLVDVNGVVYQKRRVNDEDVIYAYFPEHRKYKQVIIHGPFVDAKPLRLVAFLNAIKPIFSLSNFEQLTLESTDRRNFYIIVPNVAEALSKRSRKALRSTAETKEPLPGILSLPDALRLQDRKKLSLDDKHMLSLCRLLLFKHVFCVADNTLDNVFVRYYDFGRGAKASAKTRYVFLSQLETAMQSDGRPVGWKTFCAWLTQTSPKYMTRAVLDWIEDHEVLLLTMLKGWQALLVDKRLVKAYRYFFATDVSTEMYVIRVYQARLAALLE